MPAGPAMPPAMPAGPAMPPAMPAGPAMPPAMPAASAMPLVRQCQPVRRCRPVGQCRPARRLHRSGSISRRGPLVGAAIALGIGAAFKLYPMMFALPIALWLVGGGWQPAADVIHRARSRWLTGISFAAGTFGVFALINLPFVIAGAAGWWASFQFQWSRPIDLTTNTIWFWGARPYSDSGNAAVQHDLALAATATTLGALLLACVLGWLRFGRDRAYPWLPVCAAMVCGYLLFNKVHSPQFVLWLLPFFVLLRIRPGWILAYFAADAAIGIGFFRWQYLIGSGAPSGSYDALSPQFVLIGVWGRAALLVALFVVFLRARVVQPPGRRRTPGPAPLGRWSGPGRAPSGRPASAWCTRSRPTMRPRSPAAWSHPIRKVRRIARSASRWIP